MSDHTDMVRAPELLDPAATRYVEFEFPDDAYFEYAFVDAQGKLRPDPANPLRADNPWYPDASALAGPEYAPDPLATPDRALERGRIERLRLTSDALDGQVRRVSVYTPHGAGRAELPLVIAQDGVAFQRLAGVHLVAEALAARGEARPARFAFVEPVDRRVEYGFSRPYLDFLHEELLPKLEGENQSSGERIWLGVSLGGLVSANAAMARPNASDTVVTLSGAFLGTPESGEFYATRDSWLLGRLADPGARLPRRWYVEVGTIEWLTDANRRAAAALRARGVDTGYLERHAGHNWTNWRNGMAAALRFALRP